LIAIIRAASGEELKQLVLRYSSDPRLGVQQALKTAAKRNARQEAEDERLNRLYARIDSAPNQAIIVGIDEVGRGALAGPLLVAAVVLPAHPRLAGLNDSKQLTADQRIKLAARIRELATAIGFGWVEAAQIDRSGMALAMRQAIQAALDQLDLEPDQVLLDGRPLAVHPRELAIVGGDGTEAPIAAASVIAKVTRDAWMIAADKEYPGYGFAANKGYGSAAHLAALRTIGPSAIHRRTFLTAIFNTQDSLF